MYLWLEVAKLVSEPAVGGESGKQSLESSKKLAKNIDMFFNKMLKYKKLLAALKTNYKEQSLTYVFDNRFLRLLMRRS
jgi:hypothetical protein